MPLQLCNREERSGLRTDVTRSAIEMVCCARVIFAVKLLAVYCDGFG